MTPYYRDDHVTLYHGDALEVRAWLTASTLVMDPPYGISRCQRSLKGRGEKPVITGEVLTRQASRRTIPAAHVALRDGVLALWGMRPALVFGSWRAPRPAGTQMRLVWDKGVPGLGGVGPWRQSDEEIYVINWPNPKFASRPYGTVIRHSPAASAGRDHPTPKPVGLMERLIGECPPGVIADPFAGSGSTLIAARNLRLPAIGVEIEERYCELIAKRLAQGVLEWPEEER